ncbi:unnamed protein product, partial [Pleuronectes platessa]
QTHPSFRLRGAPQKMYGLVPGSSGTTHYGSPTGGMCGGLIENRAEEPSPPFGDNLDPPTGQGRGEVLERPTTS